MSIPFRLIEEDPISTAVSAIVNAGELAGAATLVWRAGKVIHAAGVGWRDVEAKLPIERDTLFRIASMTKPITSAAALMLFEEGRFALNDPIARWAPEFSQMRVLRSHNGPLDQTDPAERPITFEDLLIARIEDAPLCEVLERRIFGPLGMKDTGFTVPTEKRGRRAGMYGFDEAGRLVKRLTATGCSTLPERPADMTYVSGGGGLWSTLDDYLDFSRMFVGAGAVDGLRLLRPETLALMTSNRLTEGQRASSKLLGMPIFAAGHGFGMGVAVVIEPEKADPLRCGGGAGSVGWPGAWGGWWQADPNDDSVLIFLAHNMVELHQLAQGIGLGVFDAIMRFQTLAPALPG